MSTNNSWLYTEKVKEHFMDPKNFLVDESEFDYDAKGLVGSVQCGDQMAVFIKVDTEKQIIADCRWKTYGCASAIASTSVLSEMVKGMSLDQAYEITPNDIVKELGGLPDHKIHCSVLGDKALRAAIDDYYRQNNMEDKIKTVEAKIVCQCMSVTDEEIKDAMLHGAKTYEDIQNITKAGTVCGQCEAEIRRIL
ncbi:MAG: iron-sulfur cluster assembly scaffold protein, partial [Gammaproteobacteria bacterium]|nr:iron-sulfur cluster assembly scaffold protein [Gammaproteobacteria bacterium]